MSFSCFEEAPVLDAAPDGSGSFAIVGAARDYTARNAREQERRHPAMAVRVGAVRVGLRDMGIVLSVRGEMADQSVGSLDFETPLEEAASDPVMRQLFEKLNCLRDDDEGDGLHADAMRLAIAARWLKLRWRQETKPADPLQNWRLTRVLSYVEKNLGEPISLADLARVSGLSRMYFAARFRVAMGQRPHEYVLQRRVNRAKELLSSTQMRLVDIALEVGFQSQAHFTTVFKKFTGATPGRWRAARLMSVEM